MLPVASLVALGWLALVAVLALQERRLIFFPTRTLAAEPADLGLSAEELSITSRATYMDPEQPSAGIGHVFVNGIEVWNGGCHTGRRPGRIVGRGKNGGSGS